jgi:hypothetical protein
MSKDIKRNVCNVLYAIVFEADHNNSKGNLQMQVLVSQSIHQRFRYSVKGLRHWWPRVHSTAYVMQ